MIHNDDGISSSVIECPMSYLIQGMINNTILNSPKDVFKATGNHVRFYYPLIGLTGAGLICDNRNHTDYNKGPKQQCENYSVRFCCPGGRLIFLQIMLSFHGISPSLFLASLIYTADLSSCSNRC